MEYLSIVSETGSVNVVYSHLSAISFFHKVELVKSPTEDSAVSMFMKGLKRIELETRPVKVTRARPITPEIIEKLIRLLDEDSNLIVWRTVWRIVVCYYLLYRWNDISRLRMTDVEYDEGERSYHFKLRGGKTGTIFKTKFCQR